MTPETFTFHGETLRVTSEALIVSYDSKGRELRYWAQSVVAVKDEK